MKRILIASILFTFVFSGVAVAKERALETDVSFEDLLIKGKYHFSDEAVTTVEEDKVLDGLLGIRKDFRDRIENESVRN